MRKRNVDPQGKATTIDIVRDKGSNRLMMMKRCKLDFEGEGGQ